MIAEEPEKFYKLYPYEYWVEKANMLKHKIDTDATSYDDVGMFAYGSDAERYQKMLKYELHFTYFQQVEALFELLFALKTLDDKHIWFYLSESKGHKNYKKIEKIAGGELDLDDDVVKFKDGRTLSFLEWALYAALPHNLTNKELKNTIDKTKGLLKLAAKDFSDRKAYNAYKHGMRVLPMLNHLTFTETETEEKLHKVDLSNSFTYLEIIKSRKEFNEITITYSPEQDLEKIRFISLLITNIIRSRRIQFYNEDTLQIISFSDMDPVEQIKSKHDTHRLTIKHQINKKSNSSKADS